MNDTQGEQKNKQSILIVEDERAIREIYSQKLAEEGFSVYVADDGISGIAQAMQHKPDLILLDVKMPNMDGFEMLKALRAKGEWGSRVPIIFLTNVDSSTGDAMTAIEETGPAYYIIKSSTNPSDIVSKMREVLGIS